MTDSALRIFTQRQLPLYGTEALTRKLRSILPGTILSLTIGSNSGASPIQPTQPEVWNSLYSLPKVSAGNYQAPFYIGGMLASDQHLIYTDERKLFAIPAPVAGKRYIPFERPLPAKAVWRPHVSMNKYGTLILNGLDMLSYYHPQDDKAEVTAITETAASNSPPPVINEELESIFIIQGDQMTIVPYDKNGPLVHAFQYIPPVPLFDDEKINHRMKTLPRDPAIAGFGKTVVASVSEGNYEGDDILHVSATRIRLTAPVNADAWPEESQAQLKVKIENGQLQPLDGLISHQRLWEKQLNFGKSVHATWNYRPQLALSDSALYVVGNRCITVLDISDGSILFQRRHQNNILRGAVVDNTDNLYTADNTGVYAIVNSETGRSEAFFPFGTDGRESFPAKNLLITESGHLMVATIINDAQPVDGSSCNCFSLLNQSPGFPSLPEPYPLYSPTKGFPQEGRFSFSPQAEVDHSLYRPFRHRLFRRPKTTVTYASSVRLRFYAIQGNRLTLDKQFDHPLLFPVTREQHAVEVTTKTRQEDITITPLLPPTKTTEETSETAIFPPAPSQPPDEVVDNVFWYLMDPVISTDGTVSLALAGSRGIRNEDDTDFIRIQLGSINEILSFKTAYGGLSTTAFWPKSGFDSRNRNWRPEKRPEPEPLSSPPITNH